MSFLGLASYTTMALTPVNAGNKMFISLSMLGFFYGSFESFGWSSLAISVPKQSISMIFAISAIWMNSLTFVMSYVGGRLVETRTRQAFQNNIYLLIGMTGLLMVLGIVTFFVDRKNGGKLNLKDDDEKLLALLDKETLDFEEYVRLEKEKVSFDEKAKQEKFLLSEMESSAASGGNTFS
jgi:hypothetical protein